MSPVATEASGHTNISDKDCPNCCSKMADLGDRFECPECKRTLMKDYNPF